MKKHDPAWNFLQIVLQDKKERENLMYRVLVWKLFKPARKKRPVSEQYEEAIEIENKTQRKAS